MSTVEPGVYTDREDPSVIHLIDSDGIDIMVDWETYRRAVLFALEYGQGFMGGHTADEQIFDVCLYLLDANHVGFRCHPTLLAPVGLFPPPDSDDPVDTEAQSVFVAQFFGQGG